VDERLVEISWTRLCTFGELLGRSPNLHRSNYSFQEPDAPWGVRLITSCFSLLVACGAVGFLHLLQDLAEVIGLRCLQRRELFIGRQMLRPRLLTDRQQVPVLQESSRRATEGSSDAQRHLTSSSSCSVPQMASSPRNRRSGRAPTACRFCRSVPSRAPRALSAGILGYFGSDPDFVTRQMAGAVPGRPPLMSIRQEPSHSGGPCCF
jgi:hypothetical protein